ncbi:MAG: calcium-binding protein [Pseudomonadota bacterium]
MPLNIVSFTTVTAGFNSTTDLRDGNAIIVPGGDGLVANTAGVVRFFIGGTILSTTGTGLVITDSDARLSVQSSPTSGTIGEIHGGLYGVHVIGSQFNFQNNGRITGDSVGMRFDNVQINRNFGDFFTNRAEILGRIAGVEFVDSTVDKLVNNSTISGARDGLLFGGAITGNTRIENGGLITGLGGVGIRLTAGASDLSDTVTISNTGTILGAGAAIKAGAHNTITLDNEGTITGDVFMLGGGTVENTGVILGRIIGSSGADTVETSGVITGAVILQGGDDLFDANDAVTGLGAAPQGYDVRGGAGNDTLSGGVRDDTLNGGGDADELIGGAGNDSLIGAAGNDTLFGGADADTLIGGAGADSLVGNTGNDRLVGGADADVLQGDEGNDVLIGQGGNDTLRGDGGNDTMVGGAGADVFLFSGTFDSDRITDFNVAEDVLDLTAYSISDLAGLQAAGALTDIGTNLQIDLGPTGDLGSVILVGVQIADLTDANLL